MHDYLKIKKVYGRQVLDSRGNPTVEGIIETSHYSISAIVPSGASTGKYEAKELRDNNKSYHGKSVKKAINNIKKIERKIKNYSLYNQEKIDYEMIKLDSTKDKRKLGANAILAVSLAVARSAAVHQHIPLYKWINILLDYKVKPKLPVPFANIINGGKHANNNLQFQEFMIAPVKAKSFEEATEINANIYHTLKNILEEKNYNTGLGDEGGFNINVHTPEEALNFIEEAVEKEGYKRKVKIALDAAASEFYNEKTKKYEVIKDFVKPKTSEEMVDYYKKLVKSYPIISIEDPFQQEDFGSFSILKKELKNKIFIVGDDLTVTNTERIKVALQKNSINTLLLKVNQIGTLTESLQAAKLMYKNKNRVMVSHRSGETEDTFIADLSVGIGSGMIKLGAPARGERTAKYNQLLRIESENKKLKYGL